MLGGYDSLIVSPFYLIPLRRIWNLRRGSNVGRFIPCIISSVRGLRDFLFFVLRVCVQVALVQFAAAVVHGICVCGPTGFTADLHEPLKSVINPTI